MIVVCLAGGLGNQMFQYAAGKSLSLEKQCPVLLDIRYLLDRTPREQFFVFRDYDLGLFRFKQKFTPGFLSSYIHEPNPGLWNRLISRAYLGFSSIHTYRETGFDFQDSFFKIRPPCFLKGYFQSWKYFDKYEAAIREDFRFRDTIVDSSKNLAEQIKSTQSVCLNVRRTDMVTNQNSFCLGLDYFRKAVAFITSKISSPVFYIFSDDLEWCRKHISTGYPTHIVGHEHAGPKFGNYLQLMTLCEHFIIPNSTFGWWAAWLCSHPDKLVVAPKNWFGNRESSPKDLIPKTWVQI